MTQCEWRDVKAGDIIRVVRDQSFPCDLVLLASPLDDAVCYVETKNLDGETNLKLKRGVEGVRRVRRAGRNGPEGAQVFGGVTGDSTDDTDDPDTGAKSKRTSRTTSLLARTSRRLTRSSSRRGGDVAADPPGARIECEHPNNSLYTFTGNLDVPRAAYDGPLNEEDNAHPERKKKVSLVPHNVLLRGSSLRNTEYVFGLAVYAATTRR